jgi:hypothetical protein
MGKSVMAVGPAFSAVTKQEEPGASAGAAKKKEEEEKQIDYLKVMGVDLAVLGLYAWYIFLLLLLPFIFGMIYSGILTFGAVKMQNLESRVWGIVACVMSILPFNLLGFVALTWLIIQFVLLMVLDDVTGMLIGVASIEALLGVGVGIWGLVVLMKPEVIEGFEYEPE